MHDTIRSQVLAFSSACGLLVTFLYQRVVHTLGSASPMYHNICPAPSSTFLFTAGCDIRGSMTITQICFTSADSRDLLRDRALFNIGLPSGCSQSCWRREHAKQTAILLDPINHQISKAKLELTNREVQTPQVYPFKNSIEQAIHRAVQLPKQKRMLHFLLMTLGKTSLFMPLKKEQVSTQCSPFSLCISDCFILMSPKSIPEILSRVFFKLSNINSTKQEENKTQDVTS